MGPTLVLSVSDGPHLGPMNIAIRDVSFEVGHLRICRFQCQCRACPKIGGCHYAYTDPVYWHWFTLIPAWISNYIHYKICDDWRIHSQNFQRCNSWNLGLGKTFYPTLYMWWRIDAGIKINPCKKRVPKDVSIPLKSVQSSSRTVIATKSHIIFQLHVFIRFSNFLLFVFGSPDIFFQNSPHDLTKSRVWGCLANAAMADLIQFALSYLSCNNHCKQFDAQNSFSDHSSHIPYSPS